MGWVSLASGIAITAMLGSSYAYSVYIRPLVELWGSKFWASLPFSVLVAVFAFSGIYGGRLYARRDSIRVPALLSVAATSSGMLLSSLVELVSTPLWLVLTYGVLVGIGNGVGYLPVVALTRKWFPDKAGLATGLVIFGYGGSATFFAPVKAALLELYGLSATLALMGVISLLMGLPAAFSIRDPPPGLTEHYSRFAKRRVVLPKRDTPPGEVLRTVDFWILWLSFTLVSGAGLLVIGHMARLAESRGVPTELAPLAVSTFSLMNALGRPPAGWVSDRLGKFGRPITMTAFFTAQGVLFYVLAALHALPAELFFLVAALLGFVYGSALALYPVATGDFFGIRYLSENYSYVFTGWGIGGLLFPSVGGYIADLTGGYDLALALSGTFSVAGALMCLYLKKRLALYL